MDSNYNIVDAFITSAERYQVQRSSGNSIARVIGYSSASTDKLTTTTGVLSPVQWYENFPSGYSIISTVTIPRSPIPVLW